MLQNINDYLEQKVKKCFAHNVSFARHSGVLSVLCGRDKLVEVVHYLSSDLEFKFTMLVDAFAVDYPELSHRFEINYCFLSVEKNYRVNVKVKIKDGEDVPSLSSMYKNSVWLEREVWDMYGVKFSDNPDLRRLLTDYGFKGHPLRKDFPLSGYSEVRYDAIQEKVISEPVNLVQEYREFDFVSPWEGIDRQLPGDEKASEKVREHSNKDV